MSHTVVFASQAEDQLAEIHEYIANLSETGEVSVESFLGAAAQAHKPNG